MNVRSPLRRSAAVLAGAILTGVTAVAAPAGAAEPVTPPTSTGAIGDCAQAAEARFTHQLTVLRGRALAEVALAAGVLLCAEEQVTLVAYRPRVGQAAELYDHQTLTIGNNQRQIGLLVSVPECQTQVALFFGASADITAGGPEYGDRLLGSDAGPGARSAGPRAIYEGETPGCGEPEEPPVVTVENDCDAVTVTVAAGGTPVTAEVVYGTERQTLTVAAGTSATAPFEPGTATSVQVSYLDSELPPATVALAQTSCESPGGGGSDGDGSTGGGAAGGDDGGLPVTGPAAGGIAAGAALLLTAGAALVLVARRRRTRFVA